ncbi:MAG: 23S rRNA (pseudouridine(1915)-N(3))-methyltransferase RlmH [Rhodospirillaceae bacterium]|jgi:23S rRNA (pseudouridine1915-N3)-methyltransferase|nr:23S rRNA (pseudouridine(1915)-N(3))-methyltransferase RlmH [Rhodospirillaceae bacterium]
MRLMIIAVGRARLGVERDLFEHFTDRLTWSLTLREVDIRKRMPDDKRIAEEGRLILEQVPPSARLIALDEHGRDLSSRDFAGKLTNWRDDGVSDIAFAIGGADGLDPAVTRRADLSLAFGRATWPHMLVRGLLAEQIYRAQQIAAGHPYHRD